MKRLHLILSGTMLAGAGCASTTGTQAPDARTPVPYEAEADSSSRSGSGAQGGAGGAATAAGKDDTAPPRGDPSAGLPPPRTEPHSPQPPRQEDLPPLR